jgi:predicted NUDIX family NTP pyrophosphohydrolase
MPKRSAGILLYRERHGGIEVLLVHPGGPFWATRDLGAWSIPKGEYQDGEEPLAAALREFPEVDRAGWFDPDTARQKLLPAQAELVDRLLDKLHGRAP